MKLIPVMTRTGVSASDNDKLTMRLDEERFGKLWIEEYHTIEIDELIREGICLEIEGEIS
jgi:hypothetical protein